VTSLQSDCYHGDMTREHATQPEFKYSIRDANDEDIVRSNDLFECLNKLKQLGVGLSLWKNFVDKPSVMLAERVGYRKGGPRKNAEKGRFDTEK